MSDHTPSERSWGGPSRATKSQVEARGLNRTSPGPRSKAIVTDTLSVPQLQHRRKTRPSILSTLWRNRVVFSAGLILAVVVLVAISAPLLTSHDPEQGDLYISRIPPVVQDGGTWAYPLGTDQLGRDILSRILFGARVSLVVAFVTVGISGILGVTLGLISGYYGSWVDTLIMRVVDIQLSIPLILLAIAVMAAIGANLRNLILVLGVTGWVIYARIVRGEILSVREQSYIVAARCIGASDWRIMVHHALPNVVAPIIVIGTFAIAEMIVAEAALSFLGLGVQPPTPSWGGILADGRVELATSWWIATFPGLAIALTVLSINLFGDWLRDKFDPKMRV